MKVRQLEAQLFSRPEWAHRIRSWSAALGLTTRQKLLSAAHPGPKPLPSLALQTVRELLMVSDLAGPGPGQLVAPAPRRYVEIDDGLYGVLGGSPEAFMETSCLVRLWESSTVPDGGPRIDLDLWLDHRRATQLGADWIELELPRWLDPQESSPGEGFVVYDPVREAPHHEGRWRAPRRKDEGHLLVRGRDFAGAYQHFWAEFVAGLPRLAHKLPREAACLARYALDRQHRNPVVGRLRRSSERTVDIYLPSWIPGAELRLLTALSESRPQSSREAWTVGSSLAPITWGLLERRLGIEWEGPD